MAIIQCPRCKREISDRAGACSGCGRPVSQTVLESQHFNRQPLNVLDFQSNEINNYNKDNFEPKAGYAILGFLFPIVGLILYLVWQKEKPGPAKSAGKGALIGVIIGAILGALVPIF